MYKRTSTNIIDNFIREYKFNYIYFVCIYVVYEYTTYERHILVDPKRKVLFLKKRKFFYDISGISQFFLCIMYYAYIRMIYIRIIGAMI